MRDGGIAPGDRNGPDSPELVLVSGIHYGPTVARMLYPAISAHLLVIWLSTIRFSMCEIQAKGISATEKLENWLFQVKVKQIQFRLVNL